MVTCRWMVICLSSQAGFHVTGGSVGRPHRFFFCTQQLCAEEEEAAARRLSETLCRAPTREINYPAYMVNCIGQRCFFFWRRGGEWDCLGGVGGRG